MPSSKSSPTIPKKKLPAKKQWTAARSKPSATSATKPKLARPRGRAPVADVLRLLEKHYPDAHCELNHRNPFELLVATVLSAQCTDVLVNRVTPALFEAFPTPAQLAAADSTTVEVLLGSLNLYRTKAKNIRSLARALTDRYGGEVPRTVEALTELAGVGRKTANVVLGNAFNIPSGVVVDTHVGRLSRRFGWTAEEDPVKVEKTLQKIIPKDRWVRVSHELIFHGRRHCKARSPGCTTCFLKGLCPRRGVDDFV